MGITASLLWAAAGRLCEDRKQSPGIKKHASGSYEAGQKLAILNFFSTSQWPQTSFDCLPAYIPVPTHSHTAAFLPPAGLGLARCPWQRPADTRAAWIPPHPTQRFGQGHPPSPRTAPALPPALPDPPALHSGGRGGAGRAEMAAAAFPPLLPTFAGSARTRRPAAPCWPRMRRARPGTAARRAAAAAGRAARCPSPGCRTAPAVPPPPCCRHTQNGRPLPPRHAARAAILALITAGTPGARVWRRLPVTGRPVTTHLVALNKAIRSALVNCSPCG